MTNVAALAKRFEHARTLRIPHEPTWQACFDHTHPMRGHGLNGVNIADAGDAATRRARLLDTTGTDSARKLAATIMADMTPANSRWLDYMVNGATDDERRWLSEAAEAVHANIHASNFDAEGYEAALDLVEAGWFALYIDEDRDRGGFVFQRWHISQVYALSSRADGRIDIVFRCFKLSAEQAAKEFGEKNVSDDIRKAIKDEKPDQEFEIVHAIYPRETYAVNAKLAKNMPIASCHFELKTKQPLRESGYHEMPVVVPRWAVIPCTGYGLGPTFEALPDMKQLNRLIFLEDASLDIAVTGMWIAKDDGVLNPRTVKVGPRKIIVAADTESMKPLMTGADFQVSFTKRELLQQAIRSVMMANELQPQDGPDMTAYEVHVRVQLVRKMLGPMYGRFQAEYLKLMAERCFGLAYRAGALGQAPQSLQGRIFNVVYLSPMARAQKLEEVQAVNQFVSESLAAEQEGATGATDVIDMDAVQRWKADAMGVPAKLLRDKNGVKKVREDRATAAQNTQQQQIAEPVVAEFGKAAAKRAAGGGGAR